MLSTPAFLYRIEQDGPIGQDRQLDGFELASRLSYFLWSTIPDERLFQAARAGELADEQGLRRTARSMLADERIGQGLVGNFSPIRVVRPRLGLAGDRPIRLGQVGPGEPAESGELRITNAQAATIDDQHGKPVASILYGCCRMQIDPQFAYKVATEHVGCELVGPDAAAFELAGDHAGEDGRTLSLIGGDGEPGLAGGPDPEPETFRVRFRGRPEPRRYTAAVRVVTQAGNLGVPSSGGPGEPLPGLFFVDVPVEVTVAPAASP